MLAAEITAMLSIAGTLIVFGILLALAFKDDNDVW